MPKDSPFPSEVQRDLFAAISRNDWRDAEKAIRDGANVNEQNSLNNLTPLQFAAAISRDTTRCAEILLAHGADISPRADGTASPLSLAIGNDKIALMRLIMNHTKSIGSEEDFYPLHCAVVHDKSDCLKILLEEFGDDFGIDIEEKSEEGIAPLHLAAQLGRKLCAEILLDHGCNIDILDKDDETPLHHAEAFDKPELVNFLFTRGANPNLLDRDGCAAIQYRKPDTTVRSAMHTGRATSKTRSGTI